MPVQQDHHAASGKINHLTTTYDYHSNQTFLVTKLTVCEKSQQAHHHCEATNVTGYNTSWQQTNALRTIISSGGGGLA